MFQPTNQTSDDFWIRVGKFVNAWYRGNISDHIPAISSHQASNGIRKLVSWVIYNYNWRWGNSDSNISKLPSRTSGTPMCHSENTKQHAVPRQGHFFSSLLWVAPGVACSLNLRSTRQPGLGMASEYQPWYGLVWKYVTPQDLIVDHLVSYWMASLKGISYFWTNPFTGKRSQQDWEMCRFPLQGLFNRGFSSITCFEHVWNLILSSEHYEDSQKISR